MIFSEKNDFPFLKIQQLKVCIFSAAKMFSGISHCGHGEDEGASNNCSGLNHHLPLGSVGVLEIGKRKSESEKLVEDCERR